jgi:hypothetical protein
MLLRELQVPLSILSSRPWPTLWCANVGAIALTSKPGVLCSYQTHWVRFSHNPREIHIQRYSSLISFYPIFTDQGSHLLFDFAFSATNWSRFHHWKGVKVTDDLDSKGVTRGQLMQKRGSINRSSNTIVFALFWISNKTCSQNFYSNHVFLNRGPSGILIRSIGIRHSCLDFTNKISTISCFTHCSFSLCFFFFFVCVNIT